MHVNCHNFTGSHTSLVDLLTHLEHVIDDVEFDDGLAPDHVVER